MEYLGKEVISELLETESISKSKWVRVIQLMFIAEVGSLLPLFPGI